VVPSGDDGLAVRPGERVKFAVLVMLPFVRFSSSITHKGWRYAVRASVDRVAPPLVGDWTISTSDAP